MRPWFGSNGPFRASRKSPGQKSEVRTEALDLELDHDSGRMEGRCLKGKFAGRTLSSLSDGELLQLLDELRATDPQGAFLIKVHIGRRSQDRYGRHPESPRATRPVVSIPALLVVAAFLFLIFYHRLGARIGPWFGSKGPFGTSHKSPGRKSQIRTQGLEMELDHDSGHMEGRCLKGQFSGRALSSLSDGELLQLLEELRATDFSRRASDRGLFRPALERLAQPALRRRRKRRAEAATRPHDGQRGP